MPVANLIPRVFPDLQGKSPGNEIGVKPMLRWSSSDLEFGLVKQKINLPLKSCLELFLDTSFVCALQKLLPSLIKPFLVRKIRELNCLSNDNGRQRQRTRHLNYNCALLLLLREYSNSFNLYNVGEVSGN